MDGVVGESKTGSYAVEVVLVSSSLAEKEKLLVVVIVVD